MRFIYCIFLILIFASCGSDGPLTEPKEADDEKVISEALPFKVLALDDLSAFKSPSKNWQVVGGVLSDLQTDHDLSTIEGVGVLANVVQSEEPANLLTELQHGDLELHLDVMMPKGSNSGIYLQGRYEVQLFDSWKKEEVGFGDMGGIYQRWDDARPEGAQGFEGHAPRVNAAMSPGLWQHFHLLFRAPRFNQDGQKIKDAYFEFVDLNGYRIHENVVLKGPTRAATYTDEQPEGPIMFQGDHGPVAFKNIRYKDYGQDTLELKDITYALYHGKWDFIPDWDSLEPIKRGDATTLDPKAIADQPDHYGLIFTGSLTVKIPGTYLFETNIDDGGDLMIDSTLVVANEGEPGGGIERGLIDLTTGSHDLTLTYYQEVWGASVQLFYEGPQISRRSLATTIETPEWVKRERAKPKIKILPKDKPELVRGFVDHGTVKKTHAISVGNPNGIHFSYDLNEGALIKSWRGDFADVTDMWRGRGVSQLTVPLNAAVQFGQGLSIAKLNSDRASWPKYESDGFKFLGYELDDQGSPHFKYKLDNAHIEDHVIPTASGRLRRVLAVKSEDSTPIWHRIGSANSIAKLKNGLYSVGGIFYVDSDQDLITRKIEAGEELLARIDGAATSSQIEYEIIW